VQFFLFSWRVFLLLWNLALGSSCSIPPSVALLCQWMWRVLRHHCGKIFSWYSYFPLSKSYLVTLQTLWSYRRHLRCRMPLWTFHYVEIYFVYLLLLRWSCGCCINVLKVVNSCLPFCDDSLMNKYRHKSIQTVAVIADFPPPPSDLQLDREFKFLTELGSYRYFVCGWRSILIALVKMMA